MGHSAKPRRADLICEFSDCTAGVGIRRAFPLGPPAFELRLIDLEIKRSLNGINRNYVSVLDKSDGSADSRFRADVTDAEAARGAGEARRR